MSQWTEETSLAVAGQQEEDESIVPACTEDCLGDDGIDAGPEQFEFYD